MVKNIFLKVRWDDSWIERITRPEDGAIAEITHDKCIGAELLMKDDNEVSHSREVFFQGRSHKDFGFGCDLNRNFLPMIACALAQHGYRFRWTIESLDELNKSATTEDKKDEPTIEIK